VEILLALLILAVGLLGVLVLFPLGIDAARISVETTRAATIARAAKAYLFEVNGSGGDIASPFQRILTDAGIADGPWYLPYDDEFLDPDLDGGANTLSDGPPAFRVVAPGQDLSAAEYSWSMTVARASRDSGVAGPDYSLGDLWQNENLFIVQVAVYRKFDVDRARSDLAHDSIVIENVVPGGALESVRGGDHVRNLDTTTDPWSGDGFWYEVDQVDNAGRRIKLSREYWGLEDTDVPVELSHRVIGTYTFLLSAD